MVFHQLLRFSLNQGPHAVGELMLRGATVPQQGFWSLVCRAAPHLMSMLSEPRGLMMRGRHTESFQRRLEALLSRASSSSSLYCEVWVEHHPEAASNHFLFHIAPVESFLQIHPWVGIFFAPFVSRLCGPCLVCAKDLASSPCLSAWELIGSGRTG